MQETQATYPTYASTLSLLTHLKTIQSFKESDSFPQVQHCCVLHPRNYDSRYCSASVAAYFILAICCPTRYTARQQTPWVLFSLLFGTPTSALCALPGPRRSDCRHDPPRSQPIWGRNRTNFGKTKTTPTSMLFEVQVWWNRENARRTIYSTRTLHPVIHFHTRMNQKQASTTQPYP